MSPAETASSRQGKECTTDDCSPVRDGEDDQIPGDRDPCEAHQRGAMSPALNRDTARPRINSSQQSLEPIISADDESRSSEDLEVLRDKAHPRLFACGDQDNR